MLTVLLMLAGPLQPIWSLDVHELICEMAWRDLTPVARAEVTRLLATERPAESFAAACTWADRIRRDAAYRWTAPAHYVNIPHGAVGYDGSRDCDTVCVVWAIPHFAAVLRDRSRSDRARREALKFVAHFVGDIHQPLHAYADLGGNRVPVRFRGGSTNLHALWDGELPRALGYDRSAADRLYAAIAPVDRTRWMARLDQVTWANESFALVERQVYADLEDGVAGHDYVERNRHAVTARIQAAGIRLAALLNSLLALD